MIKDKNLFFAFRSLSNKNFRNLWFGQVLSAIGMHSDMVARAWLVWTLTGSSTSVGSVLLVRALPMLVLGLLYLQHHYTYIAYLH